MSSVSFKLKRTFSYNLVRRYCERVQFASVLQSVDKLLEIRLKEGEPHFRRGNPGLQFCDHRLCNAVKHIWGFTQAFLVSCYNDCSVIIITTANIMGIVQWAWEQVGRLGNSFAGSNLPTRFGPMWEFKTKIVFCQPLLSWENTLVSIGRQLCRKNSGASQAWPHLYFQLVFCQPILEKTRTCKVWKILWENNTGKTANMAQSQLGPLWEFCRPVLENTR